MYIFKGGNYMRKDGIEFSYHLNITGHIFQAFNISNPIYKAAIVPNYAVNSAVICFEKLNFPVINT